jgi:septal ring factor EnvC (AmiA/AmiB activator)
MELKDLQPMLDELKAKALGASEETKKELGIQIKSIEEKIAGIEKALPNPAEAKKALDEINKSMEDLKKSMGELFTLKIARC